MLRVNGGHSGGDLVKAKGVSSNYLKEEQRPYGPLTIALPGEEVTLVSIQGGRGLRSRLHSMGLIPGIKLRVLNNGAPGPFLIAARDFKIAIGYGIAKKILVK
jgi:ferrous iron transport protein A